MSRKIRIAVIGFGLIGRRHAEIARCAPDIDLAAIVEHDAERRVAATNIGVPIYQDLEDMLAREAPDGAVLATPTPLHLAQGLMCISENCPVLVEKPLAVTAQEAKVLTDAADAAQVPLLVGHHRRYNGMVQAAKAALDAGAIGDVRAVQATCWFYKPDCYFDIAPWRKQKGAGPISVNLVHDVGLLRYFCGDIDTVQAVALPSRWGCLRTKILQ